MEKILFVSQIFSTLYLTGLIWVIQIVQYPFFAHFKGEDFTKYHAAYTFWITPIVAPMMILEIITSILILFYPPQDVTFNLLIGGLVLAVIVWLSTFFIQVPLHERLGADFDLNVANSLVYTNWIRTVAWSLRAVLMIYLLWKSVRV